MNQTTFQPAEIYDSNGNIIQQGAFGINTPFASSTGDGVYDYIVNNLYALKDMIAAGYIAVATLPASGQTNKYYVITEGANAGKCYVWTGTAWQELTTQINGKSAYEIAVEHGFIGTEQQWLDSFTADAIAAANRAEAVQAQMEEKFSILDNVDARFANIEDHAKMTDSNVEATKKRISNVEKLLQGNLYDYQTDETVAYEKTVPAGAMPYAGLERVGCKTLVWNQLVILSNQTAERNGITYTTTSDGTVVINGTSTAVADYAPFFVPTVPTIGHVYWLRGCPADSSASTYYINTNNGACYSDGLRFTADSSTSRSIHIRVASGVTANNVTFKVQFTDLTLMFGAGNEPTLDECKALFPAESYPYNAGTLLSAGVTEVVSKKADTSTIATHTVPAEIQALDGYGWSAGTAYNYVDFERKVFVQNVARVDLGTLNWAYYAYSGYSGGYSKGINGYVKRPTTSREVANILTTVSTIVSDNQFNENNNGTNICINTEGSIKITIPNVTDSATLKTALNGIMFYYELANPIETDISAYLSDDNLIEVESGGTLTMYSDANGDDDAYHIPVPSTVEYMIDLNVATGGTENEP